MTVAGIRDVDAPRAARRAQDAAASPARLARWLSLAAAPTFALMALLTSLDASPIAKLCGASGPFAGMLPMYLLMSAFHAPPWLKLLAGRNGA